MDAPAIAHLAHLAKLAPSEEQVNRYATELTSIVGYVGQLASADVQAAHRDAQEQLGAPDGASPDPSFSRDTALAGFPQREGSYLVVPAVLGGEVSAA